MLTTKNAGEHCSTGCRNKFREKDGDGLGLRRGSATAGRDQTGNAQRVSLCKRFEVQDHKRSVVLNFKAQLAYVTNRSCITK